MEAFFVIDQNRSSANWPLAKTLQRHDDAETGFKPTLGVSRDAEGLAKGQFAELRFWNSIKYFPYYTSQTAKTFSSFTVFSLVESREGGFRSARVCEEVLKFCPLAEKRGSFCVPLCTPVYPCVPLCTPVYPCVPPCTPLPCVPLCQKDPPKKDAKFVWNPFLNSFEKNVKSAWALLKNSLTESTK
jgi:hypothetical protein